MKAEYIDHMGSDLKVVNAARVSFDKESDYEYYDERGDLMVKEYFGGHPKQIKVLSDKDKKLIKYLATHGHWTPFSHVMITMRETVPIFVARQRFKHMVGFTYNEVSRRYVDDEPQFFEPDIWRKAADNKKQGSSDEVIKTIRIWDPIIGPHESPQFELDELLNRHHHDSLCLYNSMIKDGVAPEQARMVLPQSMYTSYYVTGSLAAWGRAYKLRIDPHAQKEIQDLAKQWDDVIKNIPELSVSWNQLTTKEE